MRELRIAVSALALCLLVAAAAPAWAGDATWNEKAAEAWAAPAMPAPAGGTAWATCRLDRYAAEFTETGGPCAAPCAPVSCCPQECCPRGCWGFRVGLMGWLPGVDGDLTLNGLDSQVDFAWTDWFDNLDKIDFAIEPYVQVRYQRWYLELAGTFMKLGDSVPIENLQGVAIDAEIKMALVQGFVGWEFHRKSLSTQRPFPCLTGIVYAGARYFNMDVTATLNIPGAAPISRSSTEDWIDPIVGVRGSLDLHRQWTVFAAGDIGGFGVGSDFTWRLGGGVEYRPLAWLGLQVGWNHLDVDYSTGSGANAFKYDVTMSGPFANIVFIF